MNDLVLQFVISLVTSSGVVVALTFLLRTYFERRIQHRFDVMLQDVRHEQDKELAAVKTTMDVMLKGEELWMGERMTAFKGASELVYRCRNLTRILAETPSLTASDAMYEELSRASSALEEWLFQNRLLLDDNTHKGIHDFKSNLAAFRRTMDSLRSGNDAQELERRLTALCARLDTDYTSVVASLQALLGSI